MFDSLSRPYKQCSPLDTVNRIRDILRSHDLLPEEIYNANPFSEVYSLILSLPSSKGGFRTNGKGRTKEYCLASAYAEFIERLQNGVYASFSRTLQFQLYREFGFNYDPREKILTLEDFYQLPEMISDDLIRYSGQEKKNFVLSYFDRVTVRGAQGLVAVPFYSFQSQKDVYLPINLLLMMLGTNGMAAGNSYDEAVYQALCELIERWASALVYYNRLTPPTVPDSYISQFPEEHEIIKKIEESGKYKVVIKDFSAGISLPAVGIILFNTQDDTYRLNIGSDTSFQVALSRCLTEVFQGVADEDALDSLMLKVPEEDLLYFLNDDEESLDLRYEGFLHYTQDGSGVYPSSLFGSTPSYSFDPAFFSSKSSYKEEVENLIEFFHLKGFSVYVYDVSYLGFPSVFVYIPEVSSHGKKNAPATRKRASYDLVEVDKVEELIFNVNNLTSEEISRLISGLQTLPAYVLIKDLYNIELEEDCLGSRINASFLLAHLCFSQGRYQDAAEAYLVFQAGNLDESDYFKAIKIYMDLVSEGRSVAEIHQEIEKVFGSSLSAFDDMQNHKEYFIDLPIPKCPNCSECQLASHCITKRKMLVSRTLYPFMKKVLSD